MHPKFYREQPHAVSILAIESRSVATEKEQVVVTAGDIILFPTGEKHWHGATKDSSFAHLYVTGAESKTTQLEA